MRWHAYMRAGDWLVIASGAAVVAFTLPLLCYGVFAGRRTTREGGRIFAGRDQISRREGTVPGPLGATLVSVEPGRARVIADPGPRQYCVRQGWLARPGEIAICAPNRVSVQIAGRTRAYDSLSY